MDFNGSLSNKWVQPKKMIKNKIEADAKMHWLFLLLFEFYL